MTNQTQHTPGPWSISGVGPKSRTVYRATGESVYPICDVTADNLNRYGAGDLDANANLIAAAPDMLEALKFARYYFVAKGIPKEVKEAIRAAIAKAQGQT